MTGKSVRAHHGGAVFLARNSRCIPNFHVSKVATRMLPTKNAVVMKKSLECVLANGTIVTPRHWGGLRPLLDLQDRCCKTQPSNESVPVAQRERKGDDSHVEVE